MFEVCLVNYSTGEVAIQQVQSIRARNAVSNFRRKMRSYGILRTGDHYKITCRLGWGDMHTPTQQELNIYDMCVAR